MENIENLGQYLKNIREERKISLAQVAQELKTKLEFIQAIESNDFDKFPAPTYVKGFLGSYARYLELDPDQLITKYNENYTKVVKQELVLKGKDIPHVGLKINKNKLILWLPVAVISILIITLGTLWIFRSIKSKPAKRKTTALREKTTKIIPKKLKLTTPITTPMELRAFTTDTVWMRVYIDKKLIFEGILVKDEEKNWQAKKEFKLRVGNPAKLNLTLNNQDLGKIAPYGPVNIIINENGVTTEK